MRQVCRQEKSESKIKCWETKISYHWTVISIIFYFFVRIHGEGRKIQILVEFLFSLLENTVPSLLGRNLYIKYRKYIIRLFIVGRKSSWCYGAPQVNLPRKEWPTEVQIYRMGDKKRSSLRCSASKISLFKNSTPQHQSDFFPQKNIHFLCTVCQTINSNRQFMPMDFSETTIIYVHMYTHVIYIHVAYLIEKQRN